MKTRYAFAASLAAAALAGHAVAFPVSGEGPVFNGADEVSTGALQRQAVRAEATQQHPAIGAQNAVAAPGTVQPMSSPTRLEVRAQTRDQIAHGVKPAIGERSY